MTEYVVITKGSKSEPSSAGMCVFNLLSAAIWSIPVMQNIFPNISLGRGFLVWITFVALFTGLTLVPVLSLIPCVFSAIIYIAMLWFLENNIGDDVIRIIVKIISISFVVLMELALFTGSTITWLENRKRR